MPCARGQTTLRTCTPGTPGTVAARSVVLRLTSWPFVTAQEPRTSHHRPAMAMPPAALRWTSLRPAIITWRAGRSWNDNLIYPRLHFPSATEDETLPKRALAARDRTYRNGVQESDDVQRLLGGSPERTEDESMALSGSSSSHTHPEKPEQQVKAGCLS
jgi:hypothetical protein